MSSPRSITEAIAQLGITGRESEDEISAPCPLHAERSPSFSINTTTGLWICYAQCGGGNISQLAEKILGLSGLELQRWSRSLGSTGVSNRATPATVLDVVDEDAWLAVTTEPPADALAARNISAVAAKRLGIRWNPWNPDKDKGKPKSDPCWMIPLRHPEHHGLIGWQSKGTVTGQALTTGKKAATLFGIELVSPGTDVILVESPLDVARLITAGVHGALATFGSTVSAEQVRLLVEVMAEAERITERPTRLILAMDNPAVDEAGRKAVKRLLASKPLKHTLPLTFDYGDSVAKDVGEMTDAEILQGIRSAYAG